MSDRLRASVAAHNPVTADAALGVLEDGGTAADAAVAAILASGVSESLLTSLLSGGHGIYWDAAAGRVTMIDFFVTIPGLGDPVAAQKATAMASSHVVDIVFEIEPHPYEIGAASAGVPGLIAGCGMLSGRWGRMPWPRLVAPALAAAKAGTTMLPTHEPLLQMLSPVFLLDRGAELFAPEGELLRAGEMLHQPGMVDFLGILSEEGPESAYSGTLAEDLLTLCRERGGLIQRADLDAYEVLVSEPPSVRYAGMDVRSRRGLSRLLDVLTVLPDLHDRTPGERALALARAYSGGAEHGDTTNLAVVDAEGNACAATTSVGIGSGDWLHDVQLNSMLGEQDLRSENPIPGQRMESMMSPTMAFDANGPVLVAGAAGASRITSAMAQVVSGVLGEGRTVAEAIERPRMHRVGNTIMVEPDFEEEGEAALVGAGFEVRRFRTRHHFFGGVSGIGRAGPGADSRRDGATRLLS